MLFIDPSLRPAALCQQPVFSVLYLSPVLTLEELSAPENWSVAHLALSGTGTTTSGCSNSCSSAQGPQDSGSGIWGAVVQSSYNIGELNLFSLVGFFLKVKLLNN